MSKKFTKGKWEALPDGSVEVRSNSGQLICIYDVKRVVDALTFNKEAKLANSRLIAATPELYLMLELCMDHFDRIGYSVMVKACQKFLNRIDNGGQ